MSWLWGKKEESRVEEKLVEETEETIEEIQEDSSPDLDNKDDNGDDGDVDVGDVNDDGDDGDRANGEVLPNDEDASDESSLENSSDEDDDDDSLVVKLVESLMTSDDDETDDDISMIDETDDYNSDDDGLFISDDEDEDLPSPLSNSGKKDHTTKQKPSNDEEQDIPTTESKNNNPNNQQPKDDDETDDDDDDDGDDDDNSDSDDPATSFWEKQSLLVLAAEHDRVDILKALLKDENEEKETLLNSGIPPLHLAITFGSVNAAQSLLRMGADPGVRPNIDAVLEERKNQPEDSKVDIPNIRRFDMVTAWELAFGNKLYDEKSMSNKSSKSWSIFGSTTPAESSDGTKTTTTTTTASSTTTTRIIKPVDMAPSKREGIRHAFTAEALRSVGGDEVERLKQLVDSGMPADIDIGGKDLYGWAVDMGALRCEELLRPIEAAKYDEADNTNTNVSEESGADGKPPTTIDDNNQDKSLRDDNNNNIKRPTSFVVHRPAAEETIPQLKNRLDELESLSIALSTCLDNLAEEVSVCHGLLLMGGGASALASHVRSLRSWKAQKLSEMEDLQLECQDADRELVDLVHSTGDIGKEIANIATFNFLNGKGLDQRYGHSKTDKSNDNVDVNDSLGLKEAEAEQLNIKAQIAASENKIRKLRASIADLSEENTRDLKEVQRRGLEGGINLVRGLREELRDYEYHLSEARSMKTASKAKISMILARIPNQNNQNRNDAAAAAAAATTTKLGVENNAEYDESNKTTIANEAADIKGTESNEMDDVVVVEHPSEIDASRLDETPNENVYHPPQTKTQSPAPLSKGRSSQEGNQTANDGSSNKTSASTKIATGDSQAIAVIQPGNKGLFTVDLWEVILRIIGYERAANRRTMQNASNTSNRPKQKPGNTGSYPNIMVI